MEMMLLAVLSPVLRCEWFLGDWQIALVSTVWWYCVCPSFSLSVWLNCHPEQKMERNRPCIWPIAPQYWEICKFIQWRYVNLSVCSFVTAACLPSPYNSQFLCHYYVCYSYPAHWIVCSSVITRTIQLQRRHMGVMACHITGSSTVCSTIC